VKVVINIILHQAGRGPAEAIQWSNPEPIGITFTDPPSDWTEPVMFGGLAAERLYGALEWSRWKVVAYNSLDAVPHTWN
jgi:hypothetical protein